MKATTMYRIAAILLVLFALGHQAGFRHVDATWHADDVVRGMQSTHFAVQGFTRDYWRFFSGFGFFVTAFLLFSAVLAWELSRATPATLDAMREVRWALAGVYVVIAVMTWAYFFMAPGVLATLTAVCLALAAARTSRTNVSEIA
jgi:hypothetical protein